MRPKNKKTKQNKKKWDMNKSERTERLPCEYKMFRCLRCTSITEYCWEWLHKCNNYPHTVKEETCVTMRLGSNPGVDAICGLSLLLVFSLTGSERFFSGYSSFPLSSKTNTSKFQFDQEWLTNNHYVEVLPLNRHSLIYSLNLSFNNPLL